MKTRYLLKKRGLKGGTHPIFVALYEGEETEIVYTGQRITWKEWSKKDRRPKDEKGEVYNAIERVREAIGKAKVRLEADELPVTPFRIKQAYEALKRVKADIQLSKDKQDKKGLDTVTSLVEKWLENNLFSYQPSTQKTVKQSLGQFQLYLKTAGLSKLERQHLTPEIITQYERYLQEKKRLSNSTHGRTMKHLRWFLKTLGYDVKTIAIRTHRKEIVALTMDELTALEEVNVSHSIEMQKAKDLFLLGCYTGLRISDLKRLNSTRIVDGKICMTLKKNQKEVSIPLLASGRRILESYGMAAPKISEQELNSSIKKVCDEAKINKIVTVKTNKAGLDVETREPKYKLITSHAASKTFITLAPQKFGLTPAEIASIVGKDLKTLINHYFQIPHESALQKMISTDKAQMKIA